MIRSRLLAALTVLGFAMSIPAVATADDDVAGMLEEASEADFHGSGVLMCTWGSDSAAATYEVTRSAGMSMVEGPSGSLMSADGVSATRSGSDWYGTEVEEWAAWAVHTRYSLGETVATTRLGRPAFEVTILENGLPRIRLILDAESTVPLSTEILDGDGRVFRMAVLITFDPGTQDMPDEMPPMETMETIHPMASSGSLPAAVNGYVRADVYDAGSGAVQAFYTDGVFSFSVFEAKRSGRPEAFERATEFEAGGDRYRRIITPTSTWVHWDAPDRSYVLVGDLPPDHLLRVLEDFPAPGNRSFFVRLWRNLFG
ncbi:MAG: hypothetical protein MUP76_08105 [Acidimicrobiia bacterium]|nr:hypothetical protein [Acidimicrobiia bacterium]